jgi:hypothetical protein
MGSCWNQAWVMTLTTQLSQGSRPRVRASDQPQIFLPDEILKQRLSPV